MTTGAGSSAAAAELLAPAAGPLVVVLPSGIRDAILVHSRRDLPNEACGLIAGDAPATLGGLAVRWLPARNSLASPHRYELHPDDLVRLALDIDDARQVVWAIVHSHVGSPAVLSATDVREWRYPAALQIVVSLDPVGGQPEIRAWRVVGGEVAEVSVRRI